jgi:hypothetical protein
MRPFTGSSASSSSLSAYFRRNRCHRALLHEQVIAAVYLTP